MNYRRIIRRATHASRSIPAVAMAVLLTGSAGWIVTEAILHRLGQPAILMSPPDIWQTVIAPAAIPQTEAIIGGALALLVGMVAIILAIKPGHLNKRQRSTDSGAVIVDDVLISRFIAHELARAVQLPDSHVAVRLSRRRAKAELMPISGLPISAAQVESHLQSLLDRDRFQPRLKAQVKVATRGKVG